MKNISNQFNTIFTPVKALLIYQQSDTDGNNDRQEKDIYVESYDIGKQGNPVNAHPLTAKEMLQLAELLQAAREFKNGFLNSDGILPHKVLHLHHAQKPSVVWFSPAQIQPIFFVETLGIPSGTAQVPAMVWKAGIDQLSVYALSSNKKPSNHTALFHAPFFNVYENGNVCMGTVDIQISKNTSLEEFVIQWENYFWNSYFSHLMQDFNPVTGNIVQLWKTQVEQQSGFPVQCLKKTNLTLQHLLP